MSKKVDVLVVEDDTDIHHQMVQIIEDEGYKVHAVFNGQEALKYLGELSDSELPKCMILDLMMPVMNGMRVLDDVESNERYKSMKIIVSTAKNTMNGEITGVGSHIERLDKPMDLDALIDIVAKYCGSPSA